MSSDAHSELERRLQEHFARTDRVSPLAISTAKALFGLRRLEDELVELEQQPVAVRGPGDGDVLRVEHGDVLVLVRRRPEGLEILVSPPGIPVTVETATGSTPVDVDDDGLGLVAVDEPARLRIEFPDGSTGVTDGFDPTAA